MRILKILLVLPVLAYGLAMGYLWYEVKSKSDQMVEAAAAFAKISYEGIHLSPLGDEVGLDNILIQPLMSGDEFAIEAFRLSAPHIGYFLRAGQSMEKGKLPENLGVRFKGGTAGSGQRVVHHAGTDAAATGGDGAGQWTGHASQRPGGAGLR